MVPWPKDFAFFFKLNYKWPKLEIFLNDHKKMGFIGTGLLFQKSFPFEREIWFP